MKRAEPSAVNELLAYLAELHEELKVLLGLANQKLAALRTADAAELHRCYLDEGERTGRLLEADGRRSAVLARVAQGLPGAAGPSVTLSELAARLPEPLGSVLRARGAGLRETALELQRRNALVAAVARNLQGHLRGVFAAVAKAAQESLVYGASGQPEASGRRCWVDAVG